MNYPYSQPLAGVPGQNYASQYPSTYLPRTDSMGFQQQVMQAPVMQQGGFLKGRPVTSEEEARGVPVDFDGSVMVFPDAGHGMIYTKQLNMNDGTAIFRAYRLIDAPPPQPVPVEPPKEYAERAELEELRQLVLALQSEIAPKTRKGREAE